MALQSRLLSAADLKARGGGNKEKAARTTNEQPTRSPAATPDPHLRMKNISLEGDRAVSAEVKAIKKQVFKSHFILRERACLVAQNVAHLVSSNNRIKG